MHLKLQKYVKIKESYTLINKNILKRENWNLHVRKSEPASFFQSVFFAHLMAFIDMEL